MKTLLLLSFMLISIGQQKGEEITGKVILVVDGNTIEVATEDDTYKILIYGVDCPELEQEYGENAKLLMEKLTLNKEVEVRFQGKDRWGNRMAIVLIEGNRDPRIELLEEGLAWTSEKNPMPELEEIRQRAKEKNKGLWQENEPTPPWVFRRKQTMMQPKVSP